MRGRTGRRLAVVAALVGLAASPPALQRLDPHGGVEEDLRALSFGTRPECRTCHEPGPGKVPGRPSEWRAKADSAERCVSCHGRLPHSGTEEHLGENLDSRKHGTSGTLSCLSCHRPHRAGLNEGERRAEEKAGSGSATQMMKRRCEDCHRW